MWLYKAFHFLQSKKNRSSAICRSTYVLIKLLTLTSIVFNYRLMNYETPLKSAPGFNLFACMNTLFCILNRKDSNDSTTSP